MKSRFLWLPLLGLVPNIACATMVLQADSDADSYSFGWSGGDMTKTFLGLLAQPYYMITLHFDPSFTNAGILRLETTDGRTKTFEWNLPSALDATSSITAYDYHQGPLEGHLELSMLAGNAKITSIKIEKAIPETTVYGTTRGRYYELQIDPVPEPGTALLLGYGLAAFGFRRWRGNRQIQASPSALN